MPKELMLFVKNMVFRDGAVATLAPDLDIIGEIGNVSMNFDTVHGERLAAELGLAPRAGYELDLSRAKDIFGLDGTVAGIPYSDLHARLDQTQNHFQKHRHQ